MSNKKAVQIHTLATRTTSLLGANWVEYLVLTSGRAKRFLIATGDYKAIGLLLDFYDADQREFRPPKEVNGKSVKAIVGDYLLGDEMWINSDQLGLEFDDLDDPNITRWIVKNGWADHISGGLKELVEQSENLPHYEQESYDDKTL